MEKKIIGIFVILLLITTGLTLIVPGVRINIDQKTSTGGECPILFNNDIWWCPEGEDKAWIYWNLWKDDPDRHICHWVNPEELPDFVTFEPNPSCGMGKTNSTVTVTPGYCDSGEYHFTVYAAEWYNGYPQWQFPKTIIVNNSNRQPTIDLSPSGTISVSAGETIHINVVGSDPDVEECGDDSLSYECSDPVHFFVPQYGDPYYEWKTTLEDVGDYTVTIGVKDEDGASDEEEVLIKVVEPVGLTIKSVFQPEQVVWQNYDGIYKEDYLEEITAGKEYRATLPMVQGKNTLLFGYPTKTSYDKIIVKVSNSLNQKVTFNCRFSIFPGNKVVFTSEQFEIGPNEKDKEYPINCPQGLPLLPTKPFQWENSGEGRIELEAVSAVGISNKVVVHVKIDECMGLTIRYFPILITDNNGNPLHAVVSERDVNEHAEQATNFIKGTYPVAENNIKGVPYPWQNSILRLKLSEVQGTRWSDIIINTNKIATDFYAWQQLNMPSSNYRIVLLFPENWDNTFTGKSFAGVTAPMFPGVVLVEAGRWCTTAHEIGHTYGLWIGRNNSPCGPDYPEKPGDWPNNKAWEEYNKYPPNGDKTPGFWVNKREIKTEDTTCFMGRNPIRTTDGKWFCEDEYKWLLEKKFSIGDPDLLIMSGTIWKSGNASFGEWYRLPNGIPDVEMDSDGDYTIRFLGNNDVLINETAFNVSFELKGIEDSELECASFGFTVPYPATTNKIQILYGDNVLEERFVSANAPHITVTSPNGGESIQPSTNYTITWEAYDADSDDLVFTVGYSYDNGENWIPLATDIRGTEYNWNTWCISQGDEYLISVTASDGINTGKDTSDTTFTIFPDSTNPVIDIINPVEGLYLNNRKIIRLPITVVIGNIAIEAKVSDNVGVANASFYVDNEMKYTCCTFPYRWLYDEVDFGFHKVKVVACDYSGNKKSDEINVLKFF